MIRSAAILFVVSVLVLAPVLVAQSESEPQEEMEGSSPETQMEPPASGDPVAPAEPEPVAPPSMTASQAPEYQPVLLEYVGGEECVALSDAAAMIYRGNVKPNKVIWVVANPGYYWEIRYDDSGSSAKAPAQGNFLAAGPPLDIPCGGTSRKSPTPQNVGYRNSWPYKVIVYECVDGQKAADPLCQKDPQIDWGN